MLMPNLERCKRCGKDVAPDWIPPIQCAGRPLPGTGIWASNLTDGTCSACWAKERAKTDDAEKERLLRARLVELLGGEKAHRESRFETFTVTRENEPAFTRAKTFDARRDNLYLWGPCGVGKSHLAGAVAAGACRSGLIVELFRPPKLLRRVRRPDPVDEERAILRIVRSDVFVLDDLGVGPDTSYARQVFQEILDGRDSADRNGLVVTSKYSLDDLARKLGDDAIPSRLAGMCRVIHIPGPDWRLSKRRRGDHTPGI